MLLFFNARSQEVSMEPAPSDPGYMRQTYGVESAKHFIEFVMKQTPKTFLNQYRKVAMYKDQSFIDTLHLNRDSYTSGSGFYHKYGKLMPVERKSVLSLMCTGKYTAVCNRNINTMMDLVPDDFSNIKNSTLKRSGHLLGIITNYSSETRINYLEFNDKGLIIKNRIYKLEKGKDSVLNSETKYLYKGDTLVSREKTFITWSYYTSDTAISMVVVSHFEANSRMTSETTTQYSYRSSTDTTVHKTENLFFYNSGGNLKEQQYWTVDKLRLSYFLEYGKDRVEIYMLNHETGKKEALFSYILTR